MEFFKNKGPRVLLLDIETAPTKAYTWSLIKAFIPIDFIESHKYLLCWSAKFLGEKAIFSDALINHKNEYKKDPKNDRKILESLCKLLDEADYIIMHNGRFFDIPEVNGRLLFHRMLPPSPFKIIDTYLTAKRIFRLESNKLDYLGEFLGVGRKIKHEGAELWVKCMDGDMKAWKDMIVYNKQDVILLEKIYYILAPWDNKAPNSALYIDDNNPICRNPTCLSTKLIHRGYSTTDAGVFHRYCCKECGAWGRGIHNLLSKEKRQSRIANIPG